MIQLVMVGELIWIGNTGHLAVFDGVSAAKLFRLTLTPTAAKEISLPDVDRITDILRPVP